MKALLINIDQKTPNLALEKLALWHKQRGYDVIWDLPIMKHKVDLVFVSCIFSWNKHLCQEWEGLNTAEIGGSGYSLDIELPYYIESIKPKINWGFTTRGCVRNCAFCIVPQKEGKIRVVGDLLDLWDGKSKSITLLDNNILALPEHFEVICKQAKKCKIVLDFNQGLDIRLLNDYNAQLLNSIQHLSDLRFAWDNISDEKVVLGGIEILKRNNCKRAMFYVIVGFDSTIEEDLYRFNKIKELGQRAYCMRHEKVKGNRLYNDLASWVNQPRFFNSMDFNRFQECRANRHIIKLPKQALKGGEK